MNKKIKLLTIIPTIFILGAWSGGWIISLTPQFSEISSQPINDAFNSLNALFAGLAFLGVILTVFLQMEELQDTRKELTRTSDANQQMAKDSKAKSVLDLYQAFCSPYFQDVKSSSMRVFAAMVLNEDYRRYVVSRFFVAEQLQLPSEVPQNVLDIFEVNDFSSFKKREAADRYKLDELLNFFSILTSRPDQDSVIRHCDFFYPWWRPYFLMVSVLQKVHYENNESIRNYHNQLNFPIVLEKLDEIYGYTPINEEEEMWDFVKNHPKVKVIGIQFNS